MIVQLTKLFVTKKIISQIELTAKIKTENYNEGFVQPSAIL